MMWSEENLKEFEKWLIEQSLKRFIDRIVNALPDETSTVSYLNHSNEITEALLDTVVTFITRQIEIFVPPPGPARSIPRTHNDYNFLGASKSERIDAWISCMKAEGRLARVQEPRVKAILTKLPEDAELLRALRAFVEFTPSLLRLR